MSLSYVLMALGMQQLRKLQTLLDVKAASKDRNHLALILAERLATEAGFLSVWNSLSPLLQRVYMATLFEIQSDGYTLATPSVRLLPTLKEYFIEDRNSLQGALEHLVGLGLLSREETWYVGEAYSLPEELRSVVIQQIVKRLLQEMPRAPLSAGLNEDDVVMVERYGRMFIRDLVRFTIYLTKYPLPLTKASIPYKREIPKLKNYLRTMQIEGIKGTGAWNAVPFAVIASVFVLEDMGVVDRSGDVVRLHGKALHCFIMLSDAEVREQLFQSLPRLVGGSHAHFMAVLSTWLRELPQGEWVSLDHALGDMLELQRLKQTPSWSQSLDHFIRITAACGLIDIGNHSDYGFLLRVPLWSDRHVIDQFVVQPNLDVLLSEEAPSWMHFLVGELAELKRADEMSVYRLSRESVLLLCDRGWQMADIEHCLQTFSANPPGQSVMRTIQDWVSAYDRAVLWDALVVRFSTADVFHAFISDVRAKGCIVQTIGEEAVMIRRSQELQTRQILSEIGAPPPQEVRMAPGDEALVRTKVGQRQQIGRKGTKEDQMAYSNLMSPQVMEVVRKSVVS